MATKKLQYKDIPHLCGSDPEFALFDNLKDRIVPANGLVPGTKDKPFRLSSGTVQIDGTCIELGPDPGSTLKEFKQNIITTVQEVRDILESQSKGRYELRAGALISYHDEDIKGLPDECFESGCDAEYVIYSENNRVKTKTLPPRYPRVNPKKVPIGGHVHLGFCSGQDITDEMHLLDCHRVQDGFRSFDYYIRDRFSSIERGRRYVTHSGRGAVRIKPYGIEYRSPSSFWLGSEKTVDLMYDIFEQSVRYAATLSYSSPPSKYRGGDVLDKALEVHSKYQQTVPLFC